ncbi:uncharacterized protein LOC127094850 [Lathyrus oleraceus]|uniref:uncharacterized protein LOC127094850 n=1 Tax=Pisum sativum TaxID=3888 RepID=UPI0021D3B147|nr:uncharacterized protein LOC127094850 [Pisum sativum]
MDLDSSVVIQNMVIPKLKDLGSFSIPCHISTMNFDRFLCDLGASVSLIPLSVCKKLDIEDMKPTNVSLKLADRSFEYPIVLLEDVMVRVGECYVSVEFVIMDISEYFQIPIILGRPFLATAGAIIDFKRGKLTFDVGDGKIKFIL